MKKGDSVADYDRRTTGFNVTYGRVRSEYVSDYVTLETKKTKYTDYNSGADYQSWVDGTGEYYGYWGGSADAYRNY